MPQSTTIQLRADRKLKDEASAILEDLGLDLSSGITIYLKQIVLQRGVPFPLRTQNGFTDAQEKAMLQSFAQAKKAKSYSSVRKLHTDILKS